MNSFYNKRSKRLFFALLMLTAVFTVLPLIFAISASFKTNFELMTNGGAIIPDSPTLDNFLKVLSIKKQTPSGTADFRRYFVNSVTVASINIILSCSLSSMCAYALNRGRAKYRGVFLLLFFMTLIFGTGTLNLFPLLKITTFLHLNNHLGLAIVEATKGLPLRILLFTGFLAETPTELDDAAKLDGCSFFGTWLHIILPLSKPVIGIAAVMSFCDSVKDYLLPKLMLASDSMATTLTVVLVDLKNYGTGSSAEYNYLMAGAILSFVPLILMFIVFRKYILAFSSREVLKK